MRIVENETRVTMSKRRNFVNYATLTLHDGTVLNLKPADFRIAGNSFTDDWVDSDAFQLGSVIGKTATILLDNTDNRTEEIGGQTVVYPHGKFSEYDFYMSYFVLYVCLPEEYHYNGQLRDQMIRIGTFTVTTPTSHGATIEITGVDNMYLFDKSFDDCNLNFSANPTLKSILNRCCSDCGVAIGYTNFDNQSLTISEKPQGATYRQVVSWIAQMAGCNAVITETGALNLKWYDLVQFDGWLDGGSFMGSGTPYPDGDNVDGGSFNPWNTGYVADGGDYTTPLPFHNLTAINNTSVSTDDIHFTGVLVEYNDVSAHYPNSSGWDVYTLQVTDNPFVAGYELAIATYLYGRLSSMTFRPFSCSSIQDPTIEAGDCVIVYDVKGNSYRSMVTNVVFTTGGMTEIDCKAEPPISQNSRYINPAATAVAKVEKEQQDYNAQVAHFNELASEALGYYRTDQVDPQTGATISYIHNNPTLATSTIIWKITSDGIFISEDGGQSYNAGYDTSTGTMLLNLVYAHGITADWIKTGVIEASDGLSYWDLNTGSFINGCYTEVTSSGNVFRTEKIIALNNNGQILWIYKYYVNGTLTNTYTDYVGYNENTNFSVDTNGYLQINSNVTSRYPTIYLSKSMDSPGSYNYGLEMNEGGIYLLTRNNSVVAPETNTFRVVNDIDMNFDYYTLNNVVTDLSIDWDNQHASWNLNTIVYVGQNSTYANWWYTTFDFYNGLLMGTT